MITQSFLSEIEDLNAPGTNQGTVLSVPLKEPLKHLLIGSPKAVTSTIHYLQVIGYAEVGDWSPLLPSPNPNDAQCPRRRAAIPPTP